MIESLKMGYFPNQFHSRIAVVLTLVLCVFAAGAAGQNAMAPSTGIAEVKVPKTKSGPFYTNYKEIRVGTTAKEVRSNLGKAKIDDKDGFYYKLSDDQFVQIRIDKAKKVRLLSVSYRKIDEDTPSLTDIFGPEAEAVPKKDGSLYKFVRYPEAGFWIAYTRTGGDKPMVTVTMQKMGQ